MFIIYVIKTRPLKSVFYCFECNQCTYTQYIPYFSKTKYKLHYDGINIFGIFKKAA